MSNYKYRVENGEPGPTIPVRVLVANRKQTDVVVDGFLAFVLRFINRPLTWWRFPQKEVRLTFIKWTTKK